MQGVFSSGPFSFGLEITNYASFMFMEDWCHPFECMGIDHRSLFQAILAGIHAKIG
jgi:hypothetical protein